MFSRTTMWAAALLALVVSTAHAQQPPRGRPAPPPPPRPSFTPSPTPPRPASNPPPAPNSTVTPTPVQTTRQPLNLTGPVTTTSKKPLTTGGTVPTTSRKPLNLTGPVTTTTRKPLTTGSKVATTTRKSTGGTGKMKTRQLSDFDPATQTAISDLNGKLNPAGKDVVSRIISDSPVSDAEAQRLRNTLNSPGLSASDKRTIQTLLDHRQQTLNGQNGGGAVIGGGGTVIGGGGTVIGGGGVVMPPPAVEVPAPVAVPAQVPAGIPATDGVAEAKPDRPAPADQPVYGCQITVLSGGGNAAQEGLVVGDIILSVNNKPTPDFDSLVAALAAAGGEADTVFVNSENNQVERIVLHPVAGKVGITIEEVRVR